MAAEDARHGARGFGNGGNSAVVVVLRVGDEGRQHGDGAVLAVRGEDVGEAVSVEAVIDEVAATAVRLGFDEAGGEDAAVQVVDGRVCRDVARGDDGQRFAVFCQQGVVFNQDAVVIDARARICGFHVLVSVGMMRLFYADDAWATARPAPTKNRPCGRFFFRGAGFI